MAASKQSVGILGGTFDPVHNGHIAIVNSFINSGYIDSLEVYLTPQSPHKTGKPSATYSQRLRMLMTAFEMMANVKVSDLEYTLPRPSYTFQTLRYLKKTNAGTRYHLCMGEDSLVNFKDWYNWKGILDICELLVAFRPDSSAKNGNIEHFDEAHFIEHEPVDISSTQIRERIQNGKSVAEFVPPPVLRIIKEEELYGSQES